MSLLGVLDKFGFTYIAHTIKLHVCKGSDNSLIRTKKNRLYVLNGMCCFANRTYTTGTNTVFASKPYMSQL